MVYDRKHEKIYFRNEKAKVVGKRALIMTRHFSGAGKIAPGNFRAGPAPVPMAPEPAGNHSSLYGRMLLSSL